MALSANTVFEIRSTATANNVNGGGFVTGASGVDYSQQDAAQYALTGATSAGAGAIILHASAHANMVGNIAKVVSGTNATVGWYEITAVDPGVSITVDRNWGTGAVADGVVNIGGALSLASTLDDDIFELSITGSVGIKYWVKAGTYTLGEAISISSTGTTLTPFRIEGYNATRGDNPTGSDRPVFNCGANSFTTTTGWDVSNIIFTGTASPTATLGVGKAINCKFINTSTSANAAMTPSSQIFIRDCEFVALNGSGLAVVNGSAIVSNSVFHGCGVYGLALTGTGYIIVSDSIFIGNEVGAIAIANSAANRKYIKNCTLYGAESKLGIGVHITSDAPNVSIHGCNIYGFTTGVSHNNALGVTNSSDDYNNYYNNTADVANWTKGPNDTAIDPAFANINTLSGTTATTASGVLTDSAADFSSVTDNQDYLLVISGTGVTAMNYLITGHTGTTVNTSPAISADATADKVYRIITGRNLATSALSGTGARQAFVGTATETFMDIGASQQEMSAGGGGSTMKSLGYSAFR